MQCLVQGTHKVYRHFVVVSGYSNQEYTLVLFKC